MRWSPSSLFRRARRPSRRQPFRKNYRPLLEPLETRLAPSVSVLTYHNDNLRSGDNLNETVLTPANVNSTTFGKLLSTPVDGQIYAQPLYVSGVSLTVPGLGPGKHNVVYVATEHDSLYAIDANSGQILWQDSFINPAAGVTTVPSADVNTTDLTPEIGITATPVIDPATKTLYVEVKTKEVHGTDHHYVQRLHAIDITTGAEKFGGPVTIADTIWNGGTTYTYVSGPYVFGTGDGNVNGVITFNALRQLVRPGLTLTNGNIVMAAASHGDNGPYHGWVLSYNAQTLQLDGVFNSTPNAGEGGTWQGGGGVAVDAQGNLYFGTGNGPFDANLNAQGFPSQGDYGDSIIKLAIDSTSTAAHQNQNGWGLKVVDYFTPFDQNTLNIGDVDLASGGVLLLPDSAGSAAHPHLMIASGKEGRVYLIDRDKMGHYSPTTDNVVEHASVIRGSWDTPASFNGEFYYAGGNTDVAKAFSVANGGFITTPVSQSGDTFGSQGATPSISANGAINGIVWLLDRASNQLRAYAATNLANELYTSAQAPNGRDQIGSVVKFSVPTVADGLVYVGASNSLLVYGLFNSPTNLPAAPTNLLAHAVSGNQVNLTWNNNAKNANSLSIEESTDGVHFTQVASVGAVVQSYVVVGLQPSTAYTFRIRAVNIAGPSGYSNTFSTTTMSSAGSGLDLSVGFAGAANLLSTNGSAKIAGSVLQLTDGGAGEAGSAFSTSRLNAGSFNTVFSFQLLNPSADGFTFAIQGVGPGALGPVGGGLGYGPDSAGGTGGIPTSVAVKFDLFSNAGEGPDSTGLYINGAAPTNAGSINLSNTGINLHNGHVFIASMSYDGATLKVTITDTSTDASASQTYAINIPATVGGNTAYFGFTGGTGGTTATQNILGWVYSPSAASALPVPAALNAAAVSASEVALSWSPGATGAASFLIERKSGGSYGQIAAVVGATTYLDSGLVAGTQYTYRIRAMNAAGTSAYSAEAPVTLLSLPLAPSNVKPARITSNEVDFTWQDNATNETGYRVFRQVNASSMFFSIATLPPGSTSYQDTSATPGTTYAYHVEAFNTAGYSGDSGALIVTTLTGGPAPAAPTSVVAVPGPGQVALSWASVNGATSYNIYRSTTPGAEGSTPYTTNDSTNFFTDTGLPGNTTYYYQITAVGGGGEGARSAETSATTASPSLDFSSGFTGAGALLTVNGSATINGSLLRLTDGRSNEAGSAFSKSPLDITRFTTQFSFQLLNANADGFTFCIQGASSTALGLMGGGLGYGPQLAGGTGGIPSSIAVKFDLYSNQGEGNDSTGLYLNGAAPTNAGSINLGNTGINLHSGHVFNVSMAYDGTTLKVLITDATTGASASQSYTANIPGAIGGTSGFVGFTGGTGGLAADQRILAWRYMGGTSTPQAPTGLTAAAGAGQVSLNWAPSPGAVTYNIYRSTSPGGEGNTPLQTGLTGNSFTDTGLSGGTTYYYEVTAVGVGGEGPMSTEVSATPPQPNLNFSGGFAGASGQLSVNGSAKINGSFLQVTNGGASEAGSAFSKSPLDITRFTTQFSFQLLNANADGFTFCIQGGSSTALGLMGGGLGYGPQLAGGTGGISRSVAIKFDLYSNQGEGNDSTGLYLNGAAPTNAGSVNLGNTSINLHSGHVFNVTMAYDGTTLKVLITDATTGASASQSYTVNIPGAVGGTSGFVGFTGGTGGLSADQRILSWIFISRPAAPTGLTAVAGNGQTALTWNSSTSATSYNIYRSTTPAGEGATPIQAGVTTTSFTDTGLANGTAYYYQVTAVNFLGESARSNEASATPLQSRGLNFSQGFAGASSSVVLNGSAKVNGSALQLTDGGNVEAASAFASNQVSVSRFNTQFSFQLQDTTNPGADGFTFCIQAAGPTALGVSGGGLGYATAPSTPGIGIPTGVAVKFDLFDNAGEGNNSTGLYTNGAVPTSAGSIDLTSTGINLHSGDVFNVAMTYDGTTLQTTTTDTVTHASASQSYVVNIPGSVGGNTAYVGFTAGTGGLTADQRILNWTLNPA
jgi:fibronectin type 3 domain-containing protein